VNTEFSIEIEYPRLINACIITALQRELQKDRGEGFQKLKTNEERLKWAIQYGDVNLLRALLKEGASFHYDAIAHGFVEPNQEIAGILYAKQKADQKVNGRPMIVQAVLDNDIALLTHLINDYCDINAQDPNGLTALMMAAEIGHTEIAALLLRNKVDPNLMSTNGLTALMFAAMHGHHKIVDLLIRKGAPLNVQGTYGQTALMAAVKKGHPTLVDLLVKNGAGINLKDHNGLTALMGAAHFGHIKIVDYLIQKGADPHLKSTQGGTALMIAAQEGYTQIIDLLLQHGADPNLQTDQGHTALWVACFKNKNEHMVKLLLKYGATLESISEEDLSTLSPKIQKMIDNKRRVDLPVDGMPPIVQFARDSNIGAVRRLIKNFCDINAQDPTGKTALMVAAYQGHTELVKVLLEAKAKLDLKDIAGITALVFAAYQGHTKIVDWLLKKGADPHLKSTQGGTALMIAAQEGHAKVVEVLLKKETNPSTLNQALAIAKQHARDPVAKLIEHSLATQEFQSAGNTAVITLLNDLVSTKPSTTQQGALPSFCDVESFEEYLTRTQYTQPRSGHCPLQLPERVSTAEWHAVLEKPDPNKAASDATSDRSSMGEAGAFVATLIAAVGSAIAYSLHQEHALLHAVLTHQDANAFKRLWVRTLSTQTRQALTSFLLETPLFALRFFSENLELLKQDRWNTFLNVFWDRDNGLNMVFSTNLDRAISNLTVQDIATLYLKIAQSSVATPSLKTVTRIMLEALSRDERYVSHTTLQHALRELSHSLTRFDREKIDALFRLLSIQPSAHYDPSEIQREILNQLCDFYAAQHPLTIQRVWFETLFSKHVPKMNKELFGNNIEEGQLEDPLTLEPLDLNRRDGMTVITLPNKMVYYIGAFRSVFDSILPQQYPTKEALVKAIRDYHANPVEIPPHSVIDSYNIRLLQRDLMGLNRPHDEDWLSQLQLLLDELEGRV